MARDGAFGRRRLGNGDSIMENNNVCAETNETMASIFFADDKNKLSAKKKAGEDVGGGE